MPKNSNEYDREWRRKNPEKAKAISDRYIKSEKGKKVREEYRRNVRVFNWKRYKKTSEKWYQKNRDKWNFYCRIRRYLKKNAEGSHTFEEWENLKAQYNWTCPHCGRQEPEIKLTEDHIIPLSRGGSNNILNIQPLCLSGNSKKHTKIIKYKITIKGQITN